MGHGARQARPEPLLPNYYGNVPGWLIELRDYLLDPRSVRIVEHVVADLRSMYDECEDDRAKIEDKLDQVECELQDMRERFGALLQRHIELCAQNGVEKGEHRRPRWGRWQDLGDRVSATASGD